MTRALSVTVVVPVHNGARYVGEALRSVLSQTHPASQIVVVDDGSTDGTVEILRTFGDRIELVRQERQGVARARNAGLGRAHGELLAFLDADDVWLPEKLERQVELVRARPDAGLVYCGYIVGDPDLRPLFHVPATDPSTRVRRALMFDDWGIALSSTGVVPREALAEIGGFRPELSTSADLDFAVRLDRAFGVAAVPEALVVYRTHVAQMHRNVDALEHDTRLLYDSIFTDATFEDVRRLRRRAHANLEVRLAYARLRQGRWPQSTAHLVRTLRLRPDRVLGAPLAALSRRARYRVRPGANDA